MLTHRMGIASTLFFVLVYHTIYASFLHAFIVMNML